MTLKTSEEGFKILYDVICESYDTERKVKLEIPMPNLEFNHLKSKMRGDEMTNEMKLLTALCDALGFEVDTVLDYQEREVSQSDGHKHIERINGRTNGNMTLKSFNQEWTRGKDGSYFTMLVRPEVEYKLTKRKPNMFDASIALLKAEGKL